MDAPEEGVFHRAVLQGGKGGNAGEHRLDPVNRAGRRLQFGKTFAAGHRVLHRHILFVRLEFGGGHAHVPRVEYLYHILDALHHAAHHRLHHDGKKHRYPNRHHAHHRPPRVAGNVPPRYRYQGPKAPAFFGNSFVRHFLFSYSNIVVSCQLPVVGFLSDISMQNQQSSLAPEYRRKT